MTLATLAELGRQTWQCQVCGIFLRCGSGAGLAILAEHHIRTKHPKGTSR